MKLTDKYRMSKWAFEQCYHGNDSPEIRNLITNSSFAYYYCYIIKDRPEVRKNIEDEQYLRVLERRRDEINR